MPPLSSMHFGQKAFTGGDGRCWQCVCLPTRYRSQHPPLVVSAHTDTVFPADTDLTITRENGKVHGPGIGDNSLGVAGLFGLVWMLRQDKITTSCRSMAGCQYL